MGRLMLVLVVLAVLGASAAGAWFVVIPMLGGGGQTAEQAAKSEQEQEPPPPPPTAEMDPLIVSVIDEEKVKRLVFIELTLTARDRADLPDIQADLPRIRATLGGRLHTHLATLIRRGRDLTPALLEGYLQTVMDRAMQRVPPVEVAVQNVRQDPEPEAE